MKVTRFTSQKRWPDYERCEQLIIIDPNTCHQSVRKCRKVAHYCVEGQLYCSNHAGQLAVAYLIMETEKNGPSV